MWEKCIIIMLMTLSAVPLGIFYNFLKPFTGQDFLWDFINCWYFHAFRKICSGIYSIFYNIVCSVSVAYILCLNIYMFWEMRHLVTELIIYQLLTLHPICLLPCRGHERFHCNQNVLHLPRNLRKSSAGVEMVADIINGA